MSQVKYLILELMTNNDIGSGNDFVGDCNLGAIWSTTNRLCWFYSFMHKKKNGLTYHRHNRGKENTKHTQGGNTDPGG